MSLRLPGPVVCWWALVPTLRCLSRGGLVQLMDWDDFPCAFDFQEVACSQSPDADLRAAQMQAAAAPCALLPSLSIGERVGGVALPSAEGARDLALRYQFERSQRRLIDPAAHQKSVKPRPGVVHFFVMACLLIRLDCKRHGKSRAPFGRCRMIAISWQIAAKWARLAGQSAIEKRGSAIGAARGHRYHA